MIRKKVFFRNLIIRLIDNTYQPLENRVERVIFQGKQSFPSVYLYSCCLFVIPFVSFDWIFLVNHNTKQPVELMNNYFVQRLILMGTEIA